MFTEIAERIATLVTTDAEIASFCTTKYSKQLSCIIGQQAFNPADKAACPCLVCSGLEASSRDDQKAGVKLAFGVYINDDSTEITGQIKKFKGLLNCETLAELIMTKILRLPYKSYITHFSLNADSFPIFVDKFSLLIEEPQPLRGHPALRR